MDDHDEGRDDARRCRLGMGIFWGAHGLRVSCRVWGHHVQRTLRARTPGGWILPDQQAQESCSTRPLFPCGPGAMLRTGGHTALAPTFL